MTRRSMTTSVSEGFVVKLHQKPQTKLSVTCADFRSCRVRRLELQDVALGKVQQLRAMKCHGSICLTSINQGVEDLGV